MRVPSFILPSIYMAFVLVLSVLTPPEKVQRLTYADKLAHFAFYAMMGFLLMRAFQREGVRKSSLWGFAVSFAYGALIEVLQGFLPERRADVLDAASNGAGSFLGVFLYGRLCERAERRRI